MVGQDNIYQHRAKRFLSRTPGDHGKEQTVKFLSVLYKAESQLADLERRVDEVDSSYWSNELRRVSEELSDVSGDIYRFQKGITSPDENLSESIDIDSSEVDAGAVSEILTQLGWEWLPRELDRLYSTQDRVQRKVDAKKQRLATNRIVLLSFIAVILSVIALLSRYLV